MNKHFIKGFLKVAEPELVKQNGPGGDWNDSSSARYKRQKILEYYESGESSDQERKAVKDTSVKNPNDPVSMYNPI